MGFPEDGKGTNDNNESRSSSRSTPTRKGKDRQSRAVSPVQVDLMKSFSLQKFLDQVVFAKKSSRKSSRVRSSKAPRTPRNLDKVKLSDKSFFPCYLWSKNHFIKDTHQGE